MHKLLYRREKSVLEKLNAAGYEAYFVGGCVRDVLMKNQEDTAISVGDVDITTNALPHQIKAVFADYRILDTGIKHGTVTVLLPEANDDMGHCSDTGNEAETIPVEITTYRKDGGYSDKRHPDKVEFVSEIELDLERRDFTINAIACDIKGEIKDPFGGMEDVQNRIIRAVGCPEERFSEDALRIMRALRFSSTFGFEIESETAKGIFQKKHLLREISAERIFIEFKKILSGKDAGNVIRRYVDVLGEVVPELSSMKGFLQHNPYHEYDVLEHCIRAMEEIKTTAGNRYYMKMAALFHDIGKPETYTMDENGIGHFYGHPAKSAEIVAEIMKRFKADKFTAQRLAVLVKRHDLIFEKDEHLLKRWMSRLGPDVLLEILEIKRADNFATGNMSDELSGKFNEIREMIEGILSEPHCFSLKDLAVTGDDVLALGVSCGPQVGKVLDFLLEEVIEERVANDRDELIQAAAGYIG